jgi:hypothetical protein
MPLSRTLILAVFCLCLSGCVVVWGGAYHIEAHTRSSITIKWDPIGTDFAEVTKVAKAYCAQGGLDALKGSAVTTPYGLQTVTFDCKPAASPALR